MTLLTFVSIDESGNTIQAETMCTCDGAHFTMNSSRALHTHPCAPQLPSRHGVQLREGAKNGRRALLIIAQAGQGPSDRQERRRLRDAAEQTARQARREERRRRAEEKQKALDDAFSAVRKPSTPGLAFTVAITAGVVALAEVRQSAIKT